MARIKETKLPGVGVRHEFTTKDGEHVGVVWHRSGRREIFVGDPADPDACRTLMELGEDDSRTLGELLGAPQISEELARLQQAIEGLTIDWLPVRADSPYTNRTVGDAQIRTRTGVSIVAIVRGEEAVPAPGPEEELRPGDYLVVVGTSRGIERVVELLHRG
jgi:TrkA domain protein